MAIVLLVSNFSLNSEIWEVDSTVFVIKGAKKQKKNLTQKTQNKKFKNNYRTLFGNR